MDQSLLSLVVNSKASRFTQYKYNKKAVTDIIHNDHSIYFDLSKILTILFGNKNVFYRLALILTITIATIKVKDKSSTHQNRRSV